MLALSCCSPSHKHLATNHRQGACALPRDLICRDRGAADVVWGRLRCPAGGTHPRWRHPIVLLEERTHGGDIDCPAGGTHTRWRHPIALLEERTHDRHIRSARTAQAPPPIIHTTPVPTTQKTAPPKNLNFCPQNYRLK